MLKIKNLLMLFLVFQCTSVVFSQKLKYKELYPILKSDTINFDLAKQLLSDYIKEEPDFPNAYYQYASFSKKHIKDLDVLTETNLIVKYCDIAITNYTLFLNITNEKDLKNNKEYYPEFVKNNTNNKPDINYIETTQLVKQFIIDLQNYSQKIKDISLLFYKGVDNYENARKIYLEINNKYLSENDIYLLADETFINRCNQLVVSYDSAVFYILAYSKLIKDFPIGKYNQQFIFKKIETFRLDGFDAQTSFLLNNITVWDYGFWAKKTLKLISIEIQDLRKKLDNTEKELSDGIKILRDTSQLYSLPNEYRFNKTTLLKLKKYDFNSMVLNLFLFQKTQLDWLILMRDKQKIDSSSIAMDDKFIFYGKVLKALYLSDSLLIDLKTSITDKNLQKYQSFVNKYYENNANFIQYVENNKKEIDLFINIYNNKSFQIYYSNFIDSTKYLTYKGNLIPLFVSNSSLLYTTTAIKQDNYGNSYLSGYYKNYAKDTLNIAFILKSNKSKVLWFKSIDNTKCNSYSYCIDYKNKEIISIISSINNTDSTLSNTIVKFDANGKGKPVKKMDVNFPIACFASDSAGSHYLLVSKPFISEGNIENISVLYMNEDGNTIWKSTYQIKGKVGEVYSCGKSFLIFGDFQYFNINNRDCYGVAKNSNKTSIFALSFDNTGKINQFLPIKSKESIYLKTIKFYDIANIHLFAQRTHTESQLKESDLMHVIVNANLQVLFSN